MSVHLGWFLFATEGRLNRAPFWHFNIILSMAYLLFLLVTKEHPEEVRARMELLFVGVFLWPNLAVQAKRWHDIGRTAWWILVNFIPIAGPLYALVMTGFIKGTPGPNRFGPDPLEQVQRGQ